MKFGISPLHALLNLTKFLIFNVSAKINSFTKEQLNSLLQNKYKIKFAEVEHGFGSKITGNVARLFFKDIEAFSSVIIVPIHIVEDINIILNLIRQCNPVDKQFYSSVASRIKNFLVLNEINLTPSVHKILDHGYDFLDFFESEAGTWTGTFSEEPGEAMIRKIRRIRKDHARFTNREQNNYDTFVNSYIF